MNRKLLLSIFLFLLCVIVTIYSIEWKGYSDFEKLISGVATEIEIKKIAFIGQNKTETLTEPHSLNYIHSELSKGIETEHLTDGYSFYGEIKFSSVSKLNLDYSISRTKDQLIVGYEESSGFYKYYLIEISTNSPKQLLDMMDRLTEK